MPTREKTCSELRRTIREGIVEPICEACLPYICAHWDLPPKERLATCKPLNDWVDRMLKAESDLGVVIKVDTSKDLTGCEIARLEPLIEELPEKVQPARFWPQESSY